MRDNKNKLVALTAFIGLSLSGFGQVFPGNPTINAGQNYSIDCTESCVELEAQPFHVGETDTYVVESIDYAPPISFNEPGGTAVSVGTDDVFSPLIQLPFDFCFFGNNYSTAKVGSNGTIGLGNSFGTSNPWSFTASVPSNSLSNAGNIFGPYHDINPYVGGSVKWYLLGTAPGRIFAVVFDDLPHYSCTSMKSTFMMVLYETTNIIDVYVKEKALCTGWNSGNAVIGIQNHAGNLGYTPPNRNTSQWTVPAGSPEAWRFVPDGPPIYTVEWTDENGVVIGNGTNVTVCPEVTTTYSVTATYAACAGGAEIVVSDTVQVEPNPHDPVVNPVVIDTEFEGISCHGINDGSLTINGSVGQQPYTYFLNGEEQNTNVFTDLDAGTYLATIVDDSGCVRTDTIIIDDPGAIGFAGTGHNANCYQANDGYITTTQTGGVPDFTYSINGAPSQDSSGFYDLGPGEYTIIITDAHGCEDSITKIITEPNAPNSGITTTETEYCAEGTVQIETEGVSNGSFSSSPSGLIISSLNGTINLGGSTPGTYHVIFSFTESGCNYKDTLTITIAGFPDIGMPDHIHLCEGEYWTPNAEGVDNLVWSDGLVNGEPVLGVLGNQTFTVSGVTAEGCEVEKNIVVSTHAIPTVSFIANPTEGTPPLIVDFENTSSGADTYTWIYGDGTQEEDNSTNVTHVYEVGEYNATLIGASQYGCADTASVLIKVYFPEMIYEFPNVFTPNGDGSNDVFKIKIPENIEELNIVILNRWGNVVFEDDKLNFGWNGKVKNSGAECDDGTYFYKVELTSMNGEKKTEHGFVHLNRGKE